MNSTWSVEVLRKGKDGKHSYEEFWVGKGLFKAVRMFYRAKHNKYSCVKLAWR